NHGYSRQSTRKPTVPAHHRAAARPLARHGDAPARRGMNPVRVAIAVARKDLKSEWRTRELVPALAQFVVLALLIGNFGFQVDTHNASVIAPGILWLALVFAGLVAFGRTFAAEREQASLEAMLMTPASPVAIFAGKALAASALLVICEAVMLPALSIFFGTPFSADVIAAVLLAAGAIFLYAPDDALQGPVQRIFYLHVSSAIAAYGCFAVVLVGGIVYLRNESVIADRFARSGALIGLLFTTVTLVMGMLWAKP